MAKYKKREVPAPESKSFPEKKSGVVRLLRKIYNPMGFQKGYNFTLFFIFAGALFGFSLARLSYINVDGSAESSFSHSAAPGEWYWYRQGIFRIGITLHLATILPAGLLVVWQFVPVIRHKALLVHRINGYLVILLILLSNVGALMIARRAFGGGLETQVIIGVMVIFTTGAIVMAYYNIKRKQIDQHRAWMLRAMFYMASIITSRIIMVITALCISSIGGYYQEYSCDQILYLHSGNVSQVSAAYPACATSVTNGTSQGYTAVAVSFRSKGTESTGASLDIGFGMALWLAFLLHAVGVETYLNLTPRESQRLRAVSYEKQLEAGYSHPGSAGLTVDRWGDSAPYKPPE